MDIRKGVAQLSTKENILALFEENKGIYFSGEEIAAQLSVSRAAVWKAVNALRSDGYVIDAMPNKGYRLSMNTDILSVQGIEKYLDRRTGSLPFRFFRKSILRIPCFGRRQMKKHRKVM